MSKSILSIAIALTLSAISQSADAQILDVTFSRTGGPESMVSSIDFEFNSNASGTVAFDQLDSNGAIDVINDDTTGSSESALFVAPNPGPIDTLGLVTIGDLLDPGDTSTTAGFSTSFDLLPNALVGDDIILGFLTDDNRVGVFEVSFDDVDGGDWDGTVTFSQGLFASGVGESFLVGAVPEPSSLALLGLLAGIASLRRRK